MMKKTPSPTSAHDPLEVAFAQASEHPEVVTLGGELWVHVAELPRPLAESVRRALQNSKVPSVVRTPFQWVLHSPVIEIETGGYFGPVGVFVPQAALGRARWVLRLLVRPQEEFALGPVDVSKDED